MTIFDFDLTLVDTQSVEARSWKSVMSRVSKLVAYDGIHELV